MLKRLEWALLKMKDLSLVFVDSSLPVALDNELGSGLANFKPFGCLVYSHFVFEDELDELEPFLNEWERTFSEMKVCPFFSSLSLSYYSS